jgi:hypothetical protein
MALELERLGFKPRRVAEEGRVLIELDVSEPQLQTFYDWAELRGTKPVTPGTYRIFVQGKPTDAR